jgi:arginyl-tRNA synthetase
VLGADGKRMRTRSGDSPPLTGLLDEAVARARRVVDEASGHLPAEQRANIAEVVGIAALKYFDLSQNRTSDYVFDWDKVLALDGNSAPYLLYAYARIQSIFAKGGLDAAQVRAVRGPIPAGNEHETALALALLRFPEAVEAVLADYRPNMLTAYLYELANAYSRFYTHCPVLPSEEPTRTARLRLCDLTARTLKLGLHLLGIETLDRM